jgi:hypothetical protein
MKTLYGDINNSDEFTFNRDPNAENVKPLSVTRRHIHKMKASNAVVCYDKDFPDYIFFVPIKWGNYWFFDHPCPKNKQCNDVQVHDIVLYCCVSRMRGPTILLSLEVGDVLNLRPIKIPKSKNAESVRDLIVHIEDVNFSPSGRNAELCVRNV